MSFVLTLIWATICAWLGFYLVKDIENVYSLWWFFPYIWTVVVVVALGMIAITYCESKIKGW